MLHRFLHNKTAVSTVTLVLIVALMGIFAPFIAPHDPYATNILNKFSQFSKEYPLGTDNLGRCILSRMIYGIRPTLGLAVLTMLGTIGLGALMGLLAGYFRGITEELIMRIVDVMLSFPSQIMVFAVVALLGINVQNVIQSTQQEEIPLGDPKALEHLDAEEEKWGPEVLWDRFRKHYPKMQAFDSPGTAEILTIRPQDIGLLPRENWGYGNNSFLLHGYYNYRYLIFARVGDEKHTRARYILGVPGHYYSNEKYMASMFGFPHFVLAKTQPAQDGRFGYWYADVRMENVE